MDMDTKKSEDNIFNQMQFWILVIILIICLICFRGREDFGQIYAPVNFESRFLNCNELAYNTNNDCGNYTKPHRERICNKKNIIEKKMLEHEDHLTSLESLPDVKSLNSIDQENTQVDDINVNIYE